MCCYFLNQINNKQALDLSDLNHKVLVIDFKTKISTNRYKTFILNATFSKRKMQ